ncbi:hypothetical protein SAMN04489835_0625 [Mycolicibacterium rutilum]|uniref:Uncharacterized protein n=1 Tax=Mycolicibacterium rutilum TaxID=370526 RepID=A0A1H6IQM7_MYCRU|nr:hypothetical protein [Mycolicibacterium rutilum]SEH50302.1 hypothetical protein SAMN04489835_0625 [Mycolicibacterium rutilum]
METGNTVGRYLVEWFRPAIADEPLDRVVARLKDCATSVSSAGAPVTLLATLSVPTDEVVFAVFGSSSERGVLDVCQMAGCPAQRVTAAAEAQFWSET